MSSTWDPISGSLDIATLAQLYRNDGIKPLELINAILDRIRQRGDDHVWITLVDEAALLARAKQLQALRQQDPDCLQGLPLYGIPFAVKDNIDVAGLPTTAACPEFAYHAQQSANVVRRLLNAGAILIGKTNMDQFATGLVGTRSPYGTPVNGFNKNAIPGGSSSGSAVAVSCGLVSFALGTDTAGSGRVPAGLNNIIGLKPTRGMFSTNGLVPACRSLDCISVFSLCCDDAASVAAVMTEHDTDDAFSRAEAGRYQYRLHNIDTPGIIAVPQASELMFFGDDNYRAAFQQLIDKLVTMGYRIEEVDYSIFNQTAELIYDGPWITERKLAFGEFIEQHHDRINASVLRAVFGGQSLSAEQSFSAYYRLRELRKHASKLFSKIDALLVPTAGRHFMLADIIEDDYEANRQLGYYTNFVNLLDLAAVAAPSSLLDDGMPFGFTLIGPAFADNLLLSMADQIHRAQASTIGATAQPIPPASTRVNDDDTSIKLCVVGAHMRDLPLNPQLIAHQASFVCATRTAPHYHLYSLDQLQPPRPGLVRCNKGMAIEVEVWRLPVAQLGSFMTLVNAPLAIGTIEMRNGEQVKGFVCENYAIEGANDISDYGGWRGYLASY